MAGAGWMAAPLGLISLAPESGGACHEMAFKLRRGTLRRAMALRLRRGMATALKCVFGGRASSIGQSG